MANTISNNRISNLINSQVPFFVRNDHQTFVAFLEAYYEYLEQDTKVVNRIKNTDTYYDIDRTIDDFSEHLYDTFLKLVSRNVLADKALLLKNIKDFYRARGSEKSVKFLMRILFDEEIDFYYPKKDILKASDGKWYIEKTLRVTDTKIDDEWAPSLADLEKYISTRITGLKTEAQATIERVDRYYLTGVKIDEIVLSNVDGEFELGEQITATFNDTEATRNISSNIVSGIVSSLTITDTGFLYEVGDPVIILSNTGSGACATVATVTSGNIASLVVNDGGAGYLTNDLILVSGGGGTGGNGNVSTVLSDGSVHPNTYNITNSTISVEQDTPLNNTQYSNLKAENVNSPLIDAFYWWQYANTGPVQTVAIIDAGGGYTSRPTLSIAANNRIKALGIVGKLEIVDGGENYAIGDMIYIENIPGGYGCGALANVWNVNAAASDAISEVRLIEMTGHTIGGSGYDMNHLPTCNIDSGTGSGANVVVTALLGTGVELQAANTTLGAIQRVILWSGGSGYSDMPTIDMSGSGDGTANITATYITGVYEYPGRYLNDDGHVSSYNFLQDRDYYQNFSYVIKTKQSIDKFRSYVKTLVHPSGTKMFGEVDNDDVVCSYTIELPERENLIDKWWANGTNSLNTFNLSWSSGYSGQDPWVGSYPMIHLFDNNATTFAHTGTPSVGEREWIKIEWGQEVLIDEIQIRNRGSSELIAQRFGNCNVYVIDANSNVLYTQWIDPDLCHLIANANYSSLHTIRLPYPMMANGINISSNVTTASLDAVINLNELDVYGWDEPVDELFAPVSPGTSNTTQSLIVNTTLRWANSNGAFFNPTIYLPNSKLMKGDKVTVEFLAGNVYNVMANVSTYTPDGIYTVANSINANLIEVHSGKWLQGSVNNFVFIQVATVSAMDWKPDGSKVYIVSQTSDTGYEFNVARPWDVTSATLFRSTTAGFFNSYDGTVSNMMFKPDGTMLYVSGSTNDHLIQFDLAEAWNIQSISYNIHASFNMSADHGDDFNGFGMSANGDFVYAVGYNNDTVYQYELSEAWNVNTASYLTEQALPYGDNPEDVKFNASGNTMFIWGNAYDKLYTYSLANNWNVNAATYMANTLSPTALTGMYGSSSSQIYFKPDGTMVYIIDNISSRKTISQIPMTEAWNANTMVLHTTSTETVRVGKIINTGINRYFY